MNVSLLLEMAASAMADRVAIVADDIELTYEQLARRADSAARLFAETHSAERVVMVDSNSAAVPVALYGAALAGVPFVPVNYRLTDVQLRAIVARTAPAFVVVGPGIGARLANIDGLTLIDRAQFMVRTGPNQSIADRIEARPATDPDAIAVLLYTSGTTGEPKAAVLRHSNLVSYILSSIDLASADESETALVSVPPYHIAGVSAVLSSGYSGRRIVYLESFDPARWVTAAARHRISHAMVVPTMLGRILDVLEATGTTLGSLRTLSYGGGPMPLAVIIRAMALLPHVGFVNAYGLTETSSTIAVLGPDDHRAAIGSVDPVVRRRLSSVGRPVPSVELTIRDADGNQLPAGERGEIWVAGPQVSGEYLERSGADASPFGFNTRDSGELDAHGFLYVHGRLDDVIVRGGENLSPGEIEFALVDHPAIDQAAVVGIPDAEWGERVVAAVVLTVGRTATEAELRTFVRARLRSTRTPERIEFRAELPTNETGKLLRRVLRAELAEAFGDDATAPRRPDR